MSTIAEDSSICVQVQDELRVSVVMLHLLLFKCNHVVTNAVKICLLIAITHEHINASNDFTFLCTKLRFSELNIVSVHEIRLFSVH